MDQHENQRQHRTSQVYLKQFGFEKDGSWYVTVLDKTKDRTEDILIRDFAVTVNEFDYPDESYTIRKHFETTAGLVEGKYKMVLNTIKHQNRLTPRHEDIMRHFISSLICRSEVYRRFFTDLLADERTQDKFIEEISLFDEYEIPEIKEAVRSLEPEIRLPLVTGQVANHLVRVLRSFKAVVLKDFGGRGWFTSDNPVCIDCQNNFSWIIPLEAEIYLPLSSEYCLLLYHEKSERQENPLRKLAPNRICSLTEQMHDQITGKIVVNRSEE